MNKTNLILLSKKIKIYNFLKLINNVFKAIIYFTALILSKIFYNYLQAKKLGCQIITVPPTIIEKIENFGKTFDRLTIETVKGFLKDSRKSKFKI